VDFSSIGYNARKIVALKINKESRQKIHDFLANHPNINSLYRINSGFDYLAEIVARDPGKIKDILEDLEAQKGVLSITGYDIIDDLKREAFEI
jgi:DNA-binding Lrp family transcriptional regulator